MWIRAGTGAVFIDLVVASPRAGEMGLDGRYFI